MYKRRLTQFLSLCIAMYTASAYSVSETTERVEANNTEQVNTEAGESSISIDFTLPVTLDSKSQAIDGKRKTSIFTGEVVIRQGSLELLADRVEVDASAGAGKEMITASGRPASYRQRKDDGSMVEAQANEITYQIDSRTISLSGNALIQQNDVSVTSDAIIFDMTKEQILASTDANSEDSVRTIISPGAFKEQQELIQQQQQTLEQGQQE